MKILHITAAKLKRVGGISTVLQNLVSEQNKIDGFEARILAIKNLEHEIVSDYFDALGEKNIEEYLKDYQPDYCVIHDYFYIEYNRVVRCLKKLNIPYFIEPHGAFGRAANQKSKYKKMIANCTILRIQRKYATGYVFLNDAEKNDAIYRTENDLVIPNGILPESVKLTNKKNYHSQIEFYFLGRYDINHKGLDILLDALQIVDEKKKNVVVYLFGKGSDEANELIDSKIAQYRTIKVINKGPIYGDEKDKLLEQKGILLLTSRYEGFPMTVLESWAYGNPCIVTPGTNVMEETTKNGLGWSAELDPKEIADCIIKAKEEYSNHSEQYIERCKQYVLNNYTWEEIAKRSYQLFKNLRYKDRGKKYD